MVELHRRFPPLTERALSWDDAVAMAEACGMSVHLEGRADATMLKRMGQTRITIGTRVNLPTWGVWCVAHEIGHVMLHAAPLDYYIGSPGWAQKTESQANVFGLLALWPRPAPYPRILQIKEHDNAVELLVGVTTTTADFGPRWTSRKLTLQRYR